MREGNGGEKDEDGEGRGRDTRMRGTTWMEEEEEE